MKILIAILILCLYGKSFSQDTLFIEGGLLFGIGDINDGVKEGNWKFYFTENNIKQSEGYYFNDLPVGNWKNWLKDGRIQNEVNYDSLGQKQGLYIEYDYSLNEIHKVNYVNDTLNGKAEWINHYGVLLIEGQYENGNKNGYWKGYYNTGWLKEEGNYQNGKAQGKWIYYYKNRQIKCVGEFLYGKENGKWVWFNEDGSEKGIKFYERGIIK